MAIDGIMLSAIKNNLENKISASRINKIYQQNKYSLTFQLRQPGENIQLYTSIHPEESRIHISKEKYDNPTKPPAFCMLLRKHLVNANILEIIQPEFERILHIKIKKRNTIYTLVLEIMGRYSNVILLDNNNYILDAMKRSSIQNSQRNLYPGEKYLSPPAQDKLNPLKIDKKQFLNKIGDEFKKYAFKAILHNFRSIGPNMAKEIIYKARLDYDKNYNQFTIEEKSNIWLSFKKTMQAIKNKNYRPTLGFNRDEQVIYQSAFPLTHNKECINIKNYNNTGELFDYYYNNYIKKYKFINLKKYLINTVSKYLEKNINKQNTYKKQLEESKNAEHFKQIGELLKANLQRIKKGQKEIKLINYYDPEQNNISIELDPSLNPAENVQKYFKKYNKARKSVGHIKKQIGKYRHEERYLNEVIQNIKQAEIEDELEEIKNELIEEKYIRKKKQVNNKKNNKKPLPPYKFKSSQGYDILVGRNNHQNDRLTTKLANKEDIWLHTKKIPGSHVIIRNHTRDEIPEKTIYEAAVLAAFYSKGKMSSNLPIDYTEIKYVNKPRGAKPGLVYYNEYKTIYVDPDQGLVEELKK